MIYKGYYTLTIDEYCQLKDNPKAILLFPIPWPEKWILKAIEKLNTKIALKINKKEIESLMYDKTMIIYMQSKCNLFIVMYKSFIMSSLVDITPELLELYKKYFKKEYKPEYLNEIAQKIEKLKLMIKQNIDRIKQPELKDVDLTEIVGKIENILGYPIGQQKLFKLNSYFKIANETVKSKDNGRNK